MYSLLLCCALFLLLSATNAKAAGPTYVTGDIETDTTWTEANSPYIVTNNITVKEGVTLNVQANVTIKFNAQTDLTVLGTFNGNGEAGRMINMTRNATTGYWYGIYWGAKSNMNFNYVYFNNGTGMSVAHNVFINNSKFTDVLGNCVYLINNNDNYTVTVLNSVFWHTGIGGSASVIYIESDFLAIENETRTYTVPITIENNDFDGTYLNSNAISIYLDAAGAWASVTNVVTPMSFKGNTFGDMSISYSGIRLIRDVDAYDNATITWSGDIDAEDNIFGMDYVGVYIDDYLYANSRYNNIVSMSCNFNFIGNTADGSLYPAWRDIYIYAYGEKSVTHTGNFVMTDNTIENADYAFGLDQYGYVYDNATAVFIGDVIVERNICPDIDYMIYVYDYLYLDSDFNTTASWTGKIDVNNNTLTTCDADALEIYSYAYVYGYGDAVIDVPMNIADNYQDDSNNYFAYQYQHYYAYDHATLDVNSPTTIKDNEFRHSYGLLYMDNYWYTEDFSVMNADCPLTIVNNDAPDFSNEAIYISEIWAYSNDNSVLTIACEVQITDNNFLTREGDVIYIERGFEAEGDSTMDAAALLNIQRNILECNGPDMSGYTGVYIEDYAYAYYDEIGAQLTIVGNVQIWENVVKVAGGDGIYYYFEPDVESDVYGANAVMNFSAVSWIIMDNLVTMMSNSSVAIGWESDLNYMEIHGGDLTYSQGDVLITGNDIEVIGDDNDAIFFNVDVQVDAYSGSSAWYTVGDFLVTENTVSVVGDSNYGIEMYIDYFYAYGEQANVTMVGGEISANDNTIFVVGYDNYALVMDPDNECVFAEAYGDHEYDVNVYVEVAGGFNAIGNIITVEGVASYGIYIDYHDLYAISESFLANATCKMDITIMDNQVEIFDQNLPVTISIEGNYGLYFDHWEVEAQYATSYAVATSNLFVSGNTVTDDGRNGYGLYINEFVVVDIDESDFIGQAWVFTSAIFEENILTGGAYGVYVYNGDLSVVLLNNIITGTYDVGMYIEMAAADVIENAVFDNFGDGISLYSAGPVTLDDNMVYDNFGYGVYVTGSTITLFNGLFNENSDYGLYVYNSDATWFVDEFAEVRSNDVQFAGYIYVQDGGLLVIDLCYFELDDAYTGITKIIVENGGSMDVRNVDFDSDGDMPGLFLVDGKLKMISCSLTTWYELYLGPESDAEISASNFMGGARYGIYIDNASPRIANCLFVDCDMAGIFVEGEDASPSIENCVFLMNERGIYAYQANLGGAISNVFVLNTAAGIYGEEITGKINANTFLLNKVEIFLVGSSVTVQDNEIGYAHLIDAMSAYTPAASVLVNYIMEALSMMNISIPVSTGAVTAPTANMMSLMASMLIDHDGIMAKNSTVICQGNTYGLVSWAVYAENSVVVFSDSVEQNDIEFTWLNSDMVPAELSVPVQAMDGIYARNSQVTISNAIIEVLDTAVFLSSSNANITNSQLLADKFDVYATGDSTVTLSATLLDGKVKADGDAAITASFVLDILTADNDGKAKGGVHVVVKNAQGEVVAQGDSDASGHFLCTVVAYKLINGNKDASMNPYTVTVEYKNGAVDQKISIEDATALTVLANKDNTALYAGIVVIAVVVLLIAFAVMRRKK